MRVVGARLRLRGAWPLLVIAVLSGWSAAPGRARSRCELAFDATAWDRVVSDCRDPRWGGRERLAQAWIAWDDRRPKEALAIAEQLLETNVAPDAAYLAGYIRGRSEHATEQALARARLLQALAGYQRAGRHAGASRAAGVLSRVPRPEHHFDDKLELAQLAVTEAELSGDPAMLGRALGALAEAYDWIGMESAARESFFRAEDLMRPWPAELAHIYFKHAAFLLDLATPQDVETSLRYLDAADRSRLHAIALGGTDKVAALALALRLNRADALSQLGRLDAADRELAAAERNQGAALDADEQASIQMVRGYLAARRHDTAAAEALFVQADDGSLDRDFRWRIQLELARAYRDAGRPDEAARGYRAAIATSEQLRSAAAAIELRPWVLARRAVPYMELLALLVDQHRAIDALVVAESLHARAWQDVVLGGGAGRGITAELALTAARVRQRLGATTAPPLDAASLMAALDDREALVFFTLGAEIWSAHVVHGAVQVRRLPAGALEAAVAFMITPGDPLANRRASEALLPTALSASRAPLYIVASGPLADVPFAALRVHGRYLIEDRSVARLPGLAALRCATTRWDQRAIVLGDSRDDLPAAAREAQQLAAALGVVPSVGRAASWQALAPAHGARILHIASHGVTTPSGRAIVLSDRMLTAADVLDAGLDPQFVMLTGCATASSDDAESWNGFPSAFLAAGSQYVIATLKSVKDVAAARVTEAYYAQPAALDPIERLAAAQRQISAELPVADWASFAAWGSACGAPDPVGARP